MFNKKTTRFLLLISVLVLSLTLVACSGGNNEPAPGNNEAVDNWPEREITIIVPFAAGGGTDTNARQLQRFLEEELGVPVVIDNRGGGNTVTGTNLLANARPDGYTLGFITSPHFDFSIKALGAPYKFEDFDIIGAHGIDPGVIRVHKDAPWNTLQDLIDDMKANPPGTFTASLSGITNSNFLGLKYIEEATGVEFNIVPFDGGNPARVALAGKHVDLTHAGVFNSLHIAEDTKVLAVHYNQNLWPELTDNAPTVNEALGISTPDTGSFYGFFAPAGLKEQYPQRWEKIVEAYYNAMHSEGYLNMLKEIGEEGSILYLTEEQHSNAIQENMEAMNNFLHFWQ